MPFEWVEAISDETHLAWSRFNFENIQQLILMPKDSYTKLNAYQVDLLLNRRGVHFFSHSHKHYGFIFMKMRDISRKFVELVVEGMNRAWLFSARFLRCLKINLHNFALKLKPFFGESNQIENKSYENALESMHRAICALFFKLIFMVKSIQCGVEWENFSPTASTLSRHM